MKELRLKRLREALQRARIAGQNTKALESQVQALWIQLLQAGN